MPTISVFPNWNTNPYLNMLFLEARSRGWAVKGGTKVLDHLLKDIPGLGQGDVLHVQWTGPFEEGARSRDEYQRLVQRFLDIAGAAKVRGVHILWTVHNLVAHDTKYHDDEVVLAEALGRLADHVIVLNSRTVHAASSHFRIPSEKVLHLPHASYKGVYPPSMSRDEVRKLIGIPSGLQTVGFVGAIRPYKGVADFLAASRLVARRIPRCGVVLAGNTSAHAMKEVDQHVPQDLPVFRKHTLLSDSEMAVWMSAVDVMVLPYRRILNSGSMMLAASFGVPVVLPRLPHLLEEFGDQHWISFFPDEEDEGRRREAIADAVEAAFVDRPSKVQQAREFADSYTLWDMTRDYADLLDRLTRAT